MKKKKKKIRANKIAINNLICMDNRCKIIMAFKGINANLLILID